MIKTKDISDLIKLLPDLSSDMVDLVELGKSATKTAWKSLDKTSHQKHVAQLKKINGFDDIKIVESIDRSKDRSQKWEKNVAQRLLQLYFDQFSLDSVSFDFRKKHFACVDGRLEWEPSKLKHSFEAQFLGGVRKLYSAFYRSDEALFELALLELGILGSSDSPEKKNEIKELFMTHFSAAKDSPMSFSVEGFKDSFQNIFNGFKKHKIYISTDFAYLGAYLASLYSCLEEIGYELDVSEAFLASQIAKN